MHTDFFQNIKLFSSISSNSLERIANDSKRSFYKKGVMILDQSQCRHTFLYVVKGWLKLSKESADGEEIIEDILAPTHYCGESFLFDIEKTAAAYTVYSIADIEVITISLELLKQLMTEDNALSLNFLQVTLQKKQRLAMEIEHMSIQSAAQRIGCFILRLCDNPATQKTNVVLRFPYDKILLALRLGMQPETFSRALKKISSECSLQINGEHITIPNLHFLTQYVCQHCSRTFPCSPATT